jgi:tetratricopeptide (TPR) repeat protein
MQIDLRNRLLADIQSGSDEAIMSAAGQLFELGEYGSPKGTYLLSGGKAALRLGYWMDAAILLFNGLHTAEPDTLVRAEILVNRAVACSRVGFYRDAVQAATEFLDQIDSLPELARKWAANAHHAMGFAYDRLEQYSEAAQHNGLAAEMYTNSIGRSNAMCDLAYSLAMGGNAADADAILSRIDLTDLSGLPLFHYYVTAVIVDFALARYANGMATTKKAEELVRGSDDAWGSPLAELRYWKARCMWELGDLIRAAATGFQAAMLAERHWNRTLCDRATAWLAEINGKWGN